MFNRPSRAKKTVREGIIHFKTMATMLEQFKQIKEQYPDALLLFRCGDFYEMYHEDADKASKVLNITVTHRGDGVHMCGFPFHALDGYLPKLVRAGFRVAICDQLEPSKLEKNLSKPAEQKPEKPEKPDTQLSLAFYGEDRKSEYLYRFRDRVAMELMARNYHGCSALSAANNANELVRLLYGIDLSVN